MTSQALRRSGSAQIIQTHFKRKNMHTSNINDALPADLTAEAFEDILRAPGVRIERIVSKGHSSPESGWYDQDEHEWVMVLQGAGILSFADGSECRLSAGITLIFPPTANTELHGQIQTR